MLLLLLQLRLLDHSVFIFCIFSRDGSSIGYRSQCQPVSLSIRNEFYGSVLLLLVYDCFYCYCSVKCLNILLLYFAIEAVIAALQVTMSVHNKSKQKLT